jgi:hypothetical protein
MTTLSSLVFICLFFIAATFAQVPPWDETCVTGKYPPTDPSLFVPTYVVNLDLPPEQRWVEIAKKYRQPVNNFKKFKYRTLSE